MESADANAETIVRIAERIAAGVGADGRLLVEGHGRGLADARHVVVEFMHPVTVGKRALPSFQGLAGRREGDVTMSIAYDGAAVDDDVDIAITDRPHDRLAGSDRLTLALPRDVRESKVAAVLGYHVIWELVHLFIESATASSDGAPAASSLYPMLYDSDVDSNGIEEVRVAARRSAESKISESAATCANALTHHAARIEQVVDLVAHAGSVFTFGNGGSSTDAADAAMAIGSAARSLADDVATISALANDVAFDVVFARQLVTVGRPGDCAIAFSTSGNSPNVIEAAVAAKRIGMSTVGLAGYDGGEMARSDAFDVVIVVDSSSVHRIQEAHSALIAKIAAAAASTL